MAKTENIFRLDYVLLPIFSVLIAMASGFFFPDNAHLVIVILPVAILALIVSWFNPYIFILILLAIIPLDTMVAIPEVIKKLSLFKLLFPIPLIILCLGLVINRFRFLELNALDKAIIGWTLLNLCLIPLSVDTPAALDFCRRFVSMSFFYLLVTRLMNSPERAMQVIKVVFYSTLISVAVGSIPFLTGSNPFSKHVDPNLIRSTGGSGLDPNSYAALLFLPLWLSMAFALETSGKRKKLFFFVCFGLLLSGIVMTYSRSAFLCLIIMILLALFFWRKHISPTHLIVFLVICVFMLPLVPVDYIERIASLEQMFSNNPSDISLVRRSNYIAVGWNIFKEYPIFGAGPGNFAVLHAKAAFQPNMALIGTKRLPHNLFLQVASETGICGLLFFIVTLFCVYVSLVRLTRPNTPLSSVASATLISFAGLLFMGLFLHMLLAKTFWLILIFARIIPGMSSWKQQPSYAS